MDPDKSNSEAILGEPYPGEMNPVVMTVDIAGIPGSSEQAQSSVRAQGATESAPERVDMGGVTLKRAAAIGVMALALANAGSIIKIFDAVSVASANASPLVLEQQSKLAKAEVPQTGEDASKLGGLRLEVRKAGFLFAGVKHVGGYPKLTPDISRYNVGGWQIERKIIDRPGTANDVFEPTFKNVRPGSLQARGSKLRAIPKAIKRIISTPGRPDNPQPSSGVVEAPVTTPPVEVFKPIDLAVETEKFLESDTVNLPFMEGCSGLLIRDENGVPIGASSVQHCGLRTETRPRVRGSDGKLYVVTGQSLDVKTGNDLNSLKTIATAEQVIVPSDGDPSHDLVLVIFKGSSPEKVKAIYNASRATDTDLQPGKIIWNSGYPTAQPNNTSGVTRRQSMSMTYIGPGTVFTTNRQTIRTNLTGIKANADGSICSFGNSGAEGVIPAIITSANGTQRAVFKRIGTDASYDDFRKIGNTVPSTPEAPYFGPDILQQRINSTGYAELKNYDGVCYFTSEIAPDSVTITLVTSASQIPGSSSMNSLSAASPPSLSELTADAQNRVLSVTR